VARVTLYDIRIEFATPLASSAGSIDERRSIIIAYESEGVTGWGEAALFPSGAWEDFDTAWSALSSLDRSAEMTPKSPVAAAGLEAARIDFEAKAAGLSLHHYVGGFRRPIMATATLGIFSSPTELLEAVAHLHRSGIRALKMKITPGKDLNYVKAVRSAFTDLDLSVDGNGAYRDPDDAVLADLADSGVSLIEQPLPPGDLEGAARLRSRIEARLCLDEAIRSPEDAEKAMSAEAADVISVKVGRLGHRAAARIRAAALEHGIGIKAGGTFDTSIGRRHVLAFASTGADFAEISPPSLYLEQDLGFYPGLENGSVVPETSEAPEPDRDEVERRAIRMRTMRVPDAPVNRPSSAAP
jgi:O-succinylbenzoate synthase